ncbi:hypothetical protein P171DRAFT_104615 [Karstenula rhodostoma CBS 690.94]|uniref:Uncharacterized protein n=1 Tax=Karstenula rhodostoma CBS 690.94 TaxID=1392251 RepID=A0A9P4U7Y3_9PLEO|nr:hypothetical protein P171DRAFT_104615 [Karstenula rhodostoma CBS 690.94]
MGHQISVRETLFTTRSGGPWSNGPFSSCTLSACMPAWTCMIGVFRSLASQPSSASSQSVSAPNRSPAAQSISKKHPALRVYRALGYGWMLFSAFVRSVRGASTLKPRPLPASNDNRDTNTDHWTRRLCCSVHACAASRESAIFVPSHLCTRCRIIDNSIEGKDRRLQ